MFSIPSYKIKGFSFAGYKENFTYVYQHQMFSIPSYKINSRWGSVSLVYGISIFGGYLIPKLYISKDSSGVISPIAGGIRDVIPSARVLIRK